jgi:hypothetical protein
MGLDSFKTSDDETQDHEETVDSEFKNCRTEVLSNPDGIDTPEYVCPWVSDDGLLATMDVSPDHFRDNVPEGVKDQAKEEGLIHLDRTGSEPVIVLVDDPEEYGDLVERSGLEDYLQERLNGTV